ncbi:hypothetical protein EH165_05875 [Nakamurella antarctica]|uniref:Uncharacterized protein n=1 Tax=Nakamurella antarctica TaxID=1902245 RepID=A0A3G8ZUQ1_9ACTN|nr:hypothetical protein [Nakamurella antarctica]AZI57746.1 hypothetical protein EH165_05875 [Nakamurella antarctica]
MINSLEEAHVGVYCCLGVEGLLGCEVCGEWAAGDGSIDSGLLAVVSERGLLSAVGAVVIAVAWVGADVTTGVAVDVVVADVIGAVVASDEVIEMGLVSDD